MTTIRVKRNPGEYTTVYTPPYNNAELSWEARGLLAYLLTKPDNWTIQMVDLIKRGPAREHKLKGMIRELKAHGHIERIRNRRYGKFEWITNIYENPIMNPTIGRFSTDGSSTSGKPTDIISIDLPITKSPKEPRAVAPPLADAPPSLIGITLLPGDEEELSLEEEKEIHPHKQMVETLALVTGMDMKLNGPRLGKVASRLIKAGYGYEFIFENYRSSDHTWWYKNDWRGRDKGDMPTPEQVIETIGKVKQNGHTGHKPDKMTPTQLEETLAALNAPGEEA